MYSQYTNYITSFIDTNILNWRFKSHPHYQGILEHVNELQGNQYLFEIINKFHTLYNKHHSYIVDVCKTNDSVGDPVKFDFYNFTKCSPTDLRYVLHSMLILSYMKECSLNSVDVIEIGAGYGGLCFFLSKLSILFNININTYSIFDLDEALALQQKYLEHLGVSYVSFLNLNDKSRIENTLKKSSFLISNYAFSEISRDIQKKYSDVVLNPYTSYGFLAWNFIDVYKFVDDDKCISVEKEFPSTAPNNYYVRYRPL